MTSSDFTQLVGTDLVHGGFILLGVVSDGDLSGHAAHSVDAALVASLDEETDVGVHEGDGHGDLRAVRQDELRVLAEALDVAEDVVPAAAVEAGRVVTEFVDDFVHFKCSHDGFDQDGATDRTAGDV